MSLTKEQLITFIDLFADKMNEHKAELTEYDQHIGDGDHGINMDRGMQQVKSKEETYPDKSIDAILKDVGMTLVSTVGGASGPLYGTAFMKAGMSAKGKEELEAQDLSDMFEAMIGGIQQRGKAVQGEKTMLDALIPAKEAFDKAIAEGKSIPEALEEADKAAWEGVEYTKTIRATKGRASYLGDRSIGFQDPGASSMSYLFDSLTEASRSGDMGESEDDNETVGIVIVSHSQKIADGAKELALEMAPTANIASAGGMKDGAIGTDLQKISEAIESVMSPAGVIMLVDLGSALMTSEMAIENSDNPELVEIMDAPIVEGAIYAAIESSIGSSKEKIKDVLKRAKEDPKF